MDITMYSIRLRNVMLMHQTMIDMNNKDAYMSWIYRMPDEPTFEDFNDFASDEEEYMELYLYFAKLLKRYIKDGLFKPSEEVVEFVDGFGIPFRIYD